VGEDQMTVGVSDLSTDWSTHVYTSGITGVDAAQMTNEEKAFVIANGVLGRITNASDDIWDLRVWNFAGDIAEPQHYVLERNAANQRNALRYDCNLFAVNGSCVTGTLRQVDSGGAYGIEGGLPQLQGTVATAVSLDPTLRIGGFVQFGGASEVAMGITYTNQRPLIGGFVGFSEKPDGTGLQARIAASYFEQKAKITRNDPLSVEGYAKRGGKTLV